MDTAIPEGSIPGWGNVQNQCATQACSGIHSECSHMVPSCCYEYWGVINAGGTPDPKMEICKTISSKDQCCDLVRDIMDWDQIYCNTAGHAVKAHNQVDGKWYCSISGGKWDEACSYTRGCNATANPPGANGICAVFPGAVSPWDATYPKPQPPPSNQSGLPRLGPPTRPRRPIKYVPCRAFPAPGAEAIRKLRRAGIGQE